MARAAGLPGVASPGSEHGEGRGNAPETQTPESLLVPEELQVFDRGPPERRPAPSEVPQVRRKRLAL
ncbi:unnamed protein product [Darwinula stevensoni]|uniref:Uncharacterized protein n=1 Tax=Darwinula stevensoni TaxID=69355 RepID=A0A7R9A7J8_9CRUS|nr:unnamed protein product [Darwinula stevensoni]CAG0892177.1 unnamed protein product [Darwinula stevensoni]